MSRKSAQKNIIFFSFYFRAFRSRLRVPHCCCVYRRYTRFYVLTIRHRLVLATSAMCYGQRTFMYNLQRLFATHTICCAESFPILLFFSRSVLFNALLSLSRSSNENGVISCIGPPSHITAHLSQQQQPARQHTAPNVDGLYIRSLYTTHTSAHFFLVERPRRCRTNRKMCSTQKKKNLTSSCFVYCQERHNNKKFAVFRAGSIFFETTQFPALDIIS